MRKRDLCDSTPSPGPFPEASGKVSAFPGIQIKPRTLATNEVSSHYLLGTTSVSLCFCGRFIFSIIRILAHSDFDAIALTLKRSFLDGFGNLF